MILVDTSIWTDHLRKGDEDLAGLLADMRVLIHPCVVGEMACVNLRSRDEVLGLLADLPAVVTASHSETLYFIQRRNLMGHGIGYVDAQLLASVSLTPPACLWTRDRRLRRVAKDMDLAYVP